MMRAIGIPLIIISLLLFIRSFEKIKYDAYGNEILNSSEEVYAITDGVGIEYFLKDNLQFTSDQVFVVIISNLIMGILLIFLNKESKTLLNIKTSKLNILLCIMFITLSVLWVLNYKGSYSFFHSRAILIFSGILFFIIFSISNKLWKLFPKNIFYLSFYAFIFLLIGFSIFIELGNHFEPFVHEGNWGQVDGNFIVIFFDSIRHKWNLGYTLFRVSNIILFLLSLYFIITAKNYIQLKTENVKHHSLFFGKPARINH